MLTNKVIIYFLLSIYVILMVIVTPSNENNGNKEKQIINEKSILFNIKLMEGAKVLLNKAGNTEDIEGINEISSYTKIPDYINNTILVLRYTIILDFLNRKDKAIKLIEKLKKNSNSLKLKHREIASLLTLLINEKDIKLKEYPVSIIKETFTKEWYLNYVLNKYYKATNNINKMDIISHKIENSAISFFNYVMIYGLFFVFTFIAGLVVLFRWRNELKNKLIVNSFASDNINHIIDGYGIFILWFSLSITASFLLSRLYTEQNLSFLFTKYLLSSMIGIYIIAKLFLAKSAKSIKDFIKENMPISYEKMIIGIKGYFFAFSMVVLFRVINGIFFTEDPNKINYIFPLFSEDNPLLSIMLAFLMVSIMAPIFEEFFFRGIVFPLFKKQWGFMGAAIVSGILFGIVHLNFSLLIPISALGIILAWIYDKSGSLVSPIITHSIWNTIVLIREVFLYYNT